VTSAPGCSPSDSLIGAVDLQRELLQVARDAHRPRLVAEVALDLAMIVGTA